MPDVKFDHVVSFSSEDGPLYKADNLIAGGGGKKWRCGSSGESQASVVLQTKTPVQIGSVHVGNFGSAFVEVLVGRRESSSDGFVCLLPSSSFQVLLLHKYQNSGFIFLQGLRERPANFLP